jgi:hypothetical protein
MITPNQSKQLFLIKEIKKNTNFVNSLVELRATLAQALAKSNTETNLENLVTVDNLLKLLDLQD